MPDTPDQLSDQDAVNLYFKHRRGVQSYSLHPDVIDDAVPAPAQMGDPADAHRVIFDPTTREGNAINGLFTTIKNEVKDGDGSWNGGDVTDVLTQWFTTLGYDLDAPAPEQATDTTQRTRAVLDTRQQPEGSTAIPETVRVRDAKIRVYNQDHSLDSDDACDMYLTEVFGLSLLIRMRKGDPDDPDNPDAPFVPIDNEDREPCPLAVEVCNGGETECQI